MADINLDFIEAATEGDLKTVKQLMLGVANVDVRDSEGWTAFAMAVAHNHVEIARFLLDRGAEVDASGFKERTPLMLAANNGCMGAVVLLIENGADVKAKDADGCKASMYSDLHGYRDISRLLNDAEIAINTLSVSRPALERLRRGATAQKAKTIQ